jgi:hypothetical protein
MSQEESIRVQKLQERIEAALRENAEAIEKSDFSAYMPDRRNSFLVRRFTQAAHEAGIEGIEAALEEFDRLVEQEDPLRVQHALMIFLTHHPAVGNLGLRIPSLTERSPSQILPSKRDY